MEQNPVSAIANNAIATHRLLTSALQNHVDHMVMVSTDKAVNPSSIMGASKRIAELVLLSHASPQNRLISIRLGNVLGSSGSVVPLFQEQCKAGLPLSVTHPDAKRYFMTSSEAIASLLHATTCTVTKKILLANCERSLRVLDLAHYIASKHCSHVGQERRIEFIGLRPGEKLEEELVANGETVEPERAAGLRVVSSPHPSARGITSKIEAMQTAIRKADEKEMMSAVAQLVPGYTPVNVDWSAMQPAEVM
jgi:FlaA1/EpsC-like NDP-sugar epimerase